MRLVGFSRSGGGAVKECRLIAALESLQAAATFLRQKGLDDVDGRRMKRVQLERITR